MRQLPLLLALALLSLAADAQTASFQGLGDLPGSNFYSLAHDVSADGAVVVGRSRSVNTSGSGSSSSYEAFRWTADGGMVGLGRLPGGDIRYSSEAFAASADGAVVVGVSPQQGAGFYAFRWTADGGMVSLGRLPDARDSGARGVSADGAVVVGSSGPAAFRWTADSGMSTIDSGGSSDNVGAWGVSADGSVAAGLGCSTLVPPCYALRWTNGGGRTGLGSLPSSSYSSSEAFAVSADGAVVVGRSLTGSNQYEAFRWTAGSGMVGLGNLPGASSSQAQGVSSDGAVVVGTSGSRSFRWTADGGMQEVAALLTSAGVDISGWSITVARSVSDDGTVIVGTGLNPQGQTEAWRAVLPRAVSADPSPEAGLDLALTASPNPLRDRATVRFRLPAAGPARLAVYDALGRTVALVADGERGVGEHAFAVDTSRLPAGVYVVRLDAGGDVRALRVTVVR